MTNEATNNNTIWTWIDGNGFEYDRWADNQPDNTKNCGLMYKSTVAGKWTARACEEENYYTCKIEPSMIIIIYLPPSDNTSML